MINLEIQKKNFKDHVAKLTDYGNIKILDFKNPKSNDYRIRFLFEEDYCRLHISGDLGELIATNYNNMCYEHFFDFINNTGYFQEKIDCHSRNIFRYDIDKAREDLLKLIDEYDLNESFEQEYEWESEENSMHDVINEILSDFDNRSGIGNVGYERASKFIDNFWECRADIGREETGILDLYMLAFKLATKQLEGQGE